MTGSGNGAEMQVLRGNFPPGSAFNCLFFPESGREVAGAVTRAGALLIIRQRLRKRVFAPTRKKE